MVEADNIQNENVQEDFLALHETNVQEDHLIKIHGLTSNNDYKGPDISTDIYVDMENGIDECWWL